MTYLPHASPPLLTSAAEDVIFYAYRDNTWFSLDLIPSTRQDGADHMSPPILQLGTEGSHFLSRAASFSQHAQ